MNGDTLFFITDSKIVNIEINSQINWMRLWIETVIFLYYKKE